MQLERLLLNGICPSELRTNQLWVRYFVFNQERNSKSRVRLLFPFRRLTLLASMWTGEAFVAKNTRIVYAR
jgi:hypothetical protein